MLLLKIPQAICSFLDSFFIFPLCEVFLLHRNLRSGPHCSCKHFTGFQADGEDNAILQYCNYMTVSTNFIVFSHEFPYHIPTLLPLCIGEKKKGWLSQKIWKCLRQYSSIGENFRTGIVSPICQNITYYTLVEGRNSRFHSKSICTVDTM